MPCAIIGDSIALGTALAAPRCERDATIGISSADFAATHTAAVDADTVVISLGSNDGRLNSVDDLETVRARVSASRVVWLLPHVGARRSVQEIARLYGDAVVDVAPLVGRDGIHPTGPGYQALARKVVPDDAAESDPG